MASGIKWIKCSEEMPKKSGLYLAITVPGHIQHINYSVKHKAWNAHDEDRGTSYKIEGIEYWAEADFPKGYEGVW